MGTNLTSNFKSSVFCKSIVYLIVYVFMVQSCIWMMPPPSAKYNIIRPISSTKTYQGILSDIIEAFNGAVDLFLATKAYAASPVANAGGSYSVDKNQPLGSNVTLDGTASSHPDNDPLTYEWYGPFPTTSGPTPSVYIPEGTYTVSLIVNGSPSRSEVDTATVSVNPCFTIFARPKSGKVQLVWTHLEGTQKYDIYRADESNPFNFVKIAETTSTYATYLDEPVTNEITYLYIVGAFLPDRTCFSNVVSTHPAALRTRTPTNYAPLIYSPPITHAWVWDQ